jgi:hypothetical protein
MYLCESLSLGDSIQDPLFEERKYVVKEKNEILKKILLESSENGMTVSMSYNSFDNLGYKKLMLTEKKELPLETKDEEKKEETK